MKIWKFFTMLTVVFAATIFSAHAHTYWISATGTHKVNEPVEVKIYFGEYTTGELMKGKALDKMKDIKVIVRSAGMQDIALVMLQDTGYWKASFIPAKDGSYEIIGVNDVREVQDWNKHGYGIVRPIQFLKYVYQVGSVATPQSSTFFLDVIIHKKADGFVISLYKNAEPAANTKFFISEPGGEELVFETDATGSYFCKPTVKGLYIIGNEWVDKNPGTFSGKNYESIRYRLDASFNN